MGKVGIFSGTFDPVHLGHVELCLLACQKAGLDKVVLLPERQPRGKANVADFEHRIEMLRRAVTDYPRVEVCELNSDRFTVAETLPELKALFPHAELHMIVGSDVVDSFAQNWPDLQKLFSEVSLIIGLRQEMTQEEVGAKMHDLGVGAKYLCVKSPRTHVSSSKIRQGETGPGLHPAVSEYIVTQKLYKGEN